jgi:hypothetical protein
MIGDDNSSALLALLGQTLSLLALLGQILCFRDLLRQSPLLGQIL